MLTPMRNYFLSMLSITIVVITIFSPILLPALRVYNKLNTNKVEQQPRDIPALQMFDYEDN